jgi:very-short-patch-repair endonuclease
LRKTPTPAEAKLWEYLRGNKVAGVSFRRQHAIGPYVVDFCSPRQKLIIEFDGDLHGVQREYDAQRTAFLESQGYNVVRF